MKDTLERVKSDLQLSEPDAAVYLHLCAAGPAKVSDLADVLHVHRNDIYRATERLLARGLVETTMERPARFVAVTPSKVFDVEIEHRLLAIDNLKRSREEVMGLIDKMRDLSPATPKGIYKILQGRANIYHQRDEMIARARQSIDWACSYTPTIQHDEINGAIELMASRASEGLRLRLLTRGAHALREHLPTDLRSRDVVREFACDTPVRFFILDEKELLMWVMNDPSDSLYAEDDVAIYTTAPGFISAQLLFLTTTWAASSVRAA